MFRRTIESLLLMLCLCLWAQPGQLDPSFNIADVGLEVGLNFNSVPTCYYVQSDGKIIFGGQFTSYNGFASNNVIRLNADGTVDPTFNVGTGPNGAVTDIGLLSNGKIVLVGSFSSVNSVNSKCIILLNSDGSVDPGFNIGTGPSISFSRCVVQSDDKIIVSGNFTSVNGTPLNNLVCLNPNGTIDGSYAIGSGSANSISTLCLQTDGKLLIAGAFTSFNGTARNRIARLNTDGSVDLSFDPGTGVNNIASEIALQSDGKIVIAGLFSTYDGISRSRIARLNTNGSLDTSFDPGTGFNTTVFALAVDQNDRILVGGSFESYNGVSQNHMVRLNGDGSVDNTFNIGDGPYSVSTVFIEEIVSLADNSMLVCGGFSRFGDIQRTRFCKLTSTGAVDLTYGKHKGVDSPIYCSVALTNGRLLLAGDFTLYNGNVSRRIALVDSVGTFIPVAAYSAGFNGNVNKLLKLASGEILAIGKFTRYNGASHSNIVCLKEDGSVSTSFTTQGTDAEISSAVIQPDGKIILAGNFTQYNGATHTRLVRITQTGAIDNTFSAGSGADNQVYSVALQSDGKIVAGGLFTTFNGSAASSVVRLNSDGSMDNSFSVGSGANSFVVQLAVQSSGKILVGGYFTTFNSFSSPGLVRLNSDGQVDATFGTGMNGGVFSMDLQPDGKVLIGGDFTIFNGQGTNRIARLNVDGTLDSGFNPGTGPNVVVWYVAYQSDQRILVSGNFTQYNGTGKNQLARIFGATLPPPNLAYEDKTVSFGTGPITWVAFRNNGNTTVEYAVVSGTCASISTSGVVTISCAGTVTVSAIIPYDGTYRSDTAFATLTILKGQSILNLIANGAEAGSSPFKLHLDSIYDGVVEYKMFGDTSVATISPDGFITPKSPGTVKVQAIARENSNFLPSLTSVDVTIYPMKIKPLAANDTISIFLAQDTASKLICLNDLGRTARLDYWSVDLDPETDGIQDKFEVPALGLFKTDSTGKLYYEPFEGFLGKDSISYTISDVDGLVSDPAWIIVESEKNAALIPELKANTVMTPNGDGNNDVLLIGYADLSMRNEIWIYDENGNEVYHTEDYKNDWYGVDKKKKTLTNGIYFFIYKEFDGETVSKVYKNYCQVIR